jgi:RNA polymerase sigma factor (sigma-70 family)
MPGQLIERAEILRQFTSEHYTVLVNTLRLYLLKAGFTEAEDAAYELLNEVVVEALRHAERFDCQRQPMAWLLGIAANLIRRRQTDLARRNRREPLIRDLWRDGDQALSDDELFDRLLNDGNISPPSGHDMLSELLELLSPADQEVIKLAIEYDMSGAAVAEALHTTPGAARVRLHRALQHLRTHWQQMQEES